MHRSVIITGASSGIGEATAVHLAHKGFKVFAGARRIEKLKILEGLGQGSSRLGRIIGLELDVTNEKSVADSVARVAADSGGLWGLVNCAGVSVTGPIEELSMNEWRRQFETILFGVVQMIRAAAPVMREAGRGRIVNISSVQGRLAVPFMGCYAASKHAVEGMSDALRLELASFGVKVSVVEPGFIRTDFGEQEQSGLEHFIRDGGPYTEQLQRFKAWHAKGHPQGASPFDVAEAVHHAMTAAHPHARYVAPKRYVATLLAQKLAPAAVVDRVIARITGLSGKSRNAAAE